MPLIVRWCGHIKPNQACSTPVSSIDFFPTFAELANINSMIQVDGESFAGLLLQSRELDRESLHWHYPHHHKSGVAPCGAIRKGSYKLIEWFEKSSNGIGDGVVELFNLSEDLREQNDISNRHPKLTRKMYEELKAWRKKVGAQNMIPIR